MKCLVLSERQKPVSPQSHKEAQSNTEKTGKSASCSAENKQTALLKTEN